ncbi:rifamycin-inactivating phosphotransferase [Herpetosiphon geysericola]|uniref:Rifampicin phosphotransferase n=1 Tax=Herpetosiphon geysericola TaxID=70996 RepID=A0A0P6Y1H7_9CHLR|nr:rifamycin-inactivating phosphotransferase [Herpetosiphon geysericola]KPL91437.1 phosphoenolpyruvate synthase [Herpetosiphon geysericola]
MNAYVFEFTQINSTNSPLVGGKAANLAKLAKIPTIHVPTGFCLSTAAFQRMLELTPTISELLDQAALLSVVDRTAIAELSAALRHTIQSSPLPAEIHAAISQLLAQFGPTKAYAIRSSATAEDSPSASFAGQHDSYLNIVGEAAIIQQIKACWASLFSERAMIYRLQQGFEQRSVSLAVIVQAMVFASVSGIMFTADPITANRKLLAIEASFGLGEALVAGRVNPDSYQLRNGEVVSATIATKQHAIYPTKAGGTEEQPIMPAQQQQPALSQPQLLQLEAIGRTIEQHFGQPQDIEWCLVDEQFYIVQSRPITTFYPIPAANDAKNHIYISVGHQQMMTDAMKPLGLAIWQLTAGRPMVHAGGRLFVDIIDDLAVPARRAIMLDVLGKSDPLIRSALTTLIERGDIIPVAPAQPAASTLDKFKPTSADSLEFQPMIEHDPALVTALIAQSEHDLANLKHTIVTKSGAELCDYILHDIQQLKQSLANPQSFGVIMSAINGSNWLNERMDEWLGEKNAADSISQAVDHNITSTMGLELLDVADVIRRYPAVCDYLAQTNEPNFLDQLEQFEGGSLARQAIEAYLAKYGMRCAGEIDITRTRWSENPATLLPLIVHNIKSFAPGASHQKFAHGRQVAFNKEQELLERLQQLPDGAAKAATTKRVIDLIRSFIGYREYPKYHIVSRYFVYKQALLQAAEVLVQAKVLRDKTDIAYLTFAELHEVLRTQQLADQLIEQRKAEHAQFQKLTPPRVLTSDGELLNGSYQRSDVPAGALMGLAVSAGVVEGRARVMLQMETATLEAGDILVTRFTDPSWTPLFVAIQGLVTEVGGLMTHGAVIAREYGLPAVVGVADATKRIRDGQRIRLNGNTGTIEML